MTDVFRQQPLPDDGGFEMTGKVPDKFKKLLEQQQQEVAQPQQPVPQPIQQRPSPRAMGPLTTGIPEGNLGQMLKSLPGEVIEYGEINVPSRGRFYDDPVLATGVLHVRPMTGAEEEILATSRYVKKNEAVDMIFRRCLQEKVDTTKLLTIDRNYLLIWLRGISYSTDYEIEVKCTECDHKFKEVVNLNELPVEYCPDDFDINSLSGVLPKTGWKFSYRLSNGHDELSVAQYRERQTRNFGRDRSDDTLTHRTASLLNYIEDLEGRAVTNTSDLQILLKRLPVGDGAYLRSVVNDPPFGVNTEIVLVCDNCGADFKMDLPMESGFFFPQYKKKAEKE